MNRYMLYASSSDLYHYGIPRKSGRYPWGSGARPFQNSEGGYFSPDRKKARAEKKIRKIDAKVKARQDAAQKYYTKAEKKSSSFFATETGIRNSYDRANRYQRRANVLESKGKQYYEKQAAKLAKMDLELSETAQAIGEQFIRDVMANNRMLYSKYATTTRGYNIGDFLYDDFR